MENQQEQHDSTGLWHLVSGRTQRIPVNLYDNDQELVITAPMPGVEPEDIQVTVENKELVISAPMRGPGQERKHYLRHEWSYGSYHRAVDLPYPVDAELANASYGNGVLTLALPKSASARPHRITLEEVGPDRGRHEAHSGHEDGANLPHPYQEPWKAPE